LPSARDQLDERERRTNPPISGSSCNNQVAPADEPRCTCAAPLRSSDPFLQLGADHDRERSPRSAARPARGPDTSCRCPCVWSHKCTGLQPVGYSGCEVVCTVGIGVLGWVRPWRATGGSGLRSASDSLSREVGFPPHTSVPPLRHRAPARNSNLMLGRGVPTRNRAKRPLSLHRENDIRTTDRTSDAPSQLRADGRARHNSAGKPTTRSPHSFPPGALRDRSPMPRHASRARRSMRSGRAWRELSGPDHRCRRCVRLRAAWSSQEVTVIDDRHLFLVMDALRPRAPGTVFAR
jgi:hypothetical protein